MNKDEEDEYLYVCQRVADAPDLKDDNAVQGNCETCKERIWHKKWAPDFMPKICWYCARDKVEKNPEDEVTILPGRMARLQ
jgi:hypothetical protein